MAGKDFVIEEVTDVHQLWPELEPLVLGILDYHRPWDKRELKSDWVTPMREYMANHCRTLLARSESGLALGFLSGTVGPEVGIFEGVVAHIDNAFVVEDARGLGVGQALVRRFEAWCRDRGAAEIRLEVADRNDLGLGFWRKSGFDITMHAMRKPLDGPS